MSAITPRRIALVVLATAGLLVFAVLLFGGTHDSGVGPAGSVAFGLFATGSAVAAAMAAQGRQRLAWIAVAIGLAGWTTGNALWCYVAMGGAAPISNSSAEEFGIASVAEGIENDETARWLRTFGCDVVQGNYFCGPLPAGEIPQVPSVLTQKIG